MGRYWHHLCGQHADYNMLTNDLSDFLIYRVKFQVPWSLAKTILQEYHDACGHFGQTYTQEIILEQLYWPRMTYDI